MGVKSDLEVYVPAGSSVDIEGFQATISVRGVTGSVKAETVNGSITQAGGGEAGRAAERQRQRRRHEGRRPRQGRVGERQRDAARRLGRARGLDRERQAAGAGRFVRSRRARVGLGQACSFEAALSPRAALSIETVSGAGRAAARRRHRRRLRGVELQRADHQRARARRRASPASGRRRASSTSRPARAACASRSRRCRARSTSASGRSGSTGKVQILRGEER